MRAALLFFSVCVVACGGDSRPAAGPTSSGGDLQTARDAYQEYCGVCSGAATCCLQPADFSPTNWSKSAGLYLRAMRAHYECMRADALVESDYQSNRAFEGGETPLSDGGMPRPSGEFGGFTNLGNLRGSCEVNGCSGSAEVMAAELNRALLIVPSHPEGALVVCSVSPAK